MSESANGIVKVNAIEIESGDVNHDHATVEVVAAETLQLAVAQEQHACLPVMSPR